MNRLMICAFALFAAQTANSQLELGINVKAGIGEMERQPNEGSPIAFNEIETKPAATWGISLLASQTIHPKINLSAELGYNHLIGIENETFFITNIDNGAVTSYLSETTRKAHYLSLPVSVDFKIAPKFSLGGGVSANYMITNSRYSEFRVNGVINALTGGGNDLNRFDVGLHTQAAIELSEKFILTGKANWGMMNIRTPESRDAFSTYLGFPESRQFEVKNRQFTLGVTYLLNNNS